MEKSKKAKIAWARQFDTVNRWLDTVLAENTGSENTEFLYAKYIRAYCDMVKRTPDQLIAERKKQVKSETPEITHKAEEMLRREYLKIKKTGKKAKGVLLVRCVKSFYAKNYVPLDIKDPKVAFGKRKPVAMDDLKLLYKAANPRMKTWIAILKDSGLSREDALQLKYGEIQKAFERGDQFLPIHLIREKTQVEHDTFLGPNTVEALKLYMRELQVKGIKITAETRLMNVKGKATTKQSMGVFISRFGKKYDIALSSHRIRKLFETAMALGKVHPLIVKYWMGHKISSDIESSYIIPTIQEQLTLYRESYKNIDLVGERMEERVKALEEFKQKLTPEQRELAIRAGFKLRKTKRERKTETNGGEETFKEIGETELLIHLQSGWRIEHNLQNGRVILRMG